MAGADELVVEEIRNIIESQEDILHGWSDLQIVEEAGRRTGATATETDWAALIAEIRSATDNDGQERRDRGMPSGTP